MKVIKPSYEIMYYNPDTLKLLEKASRTCYKSEDKITDESADKFISMLISRDHTAMIEHSVITVKFISNRGFTHELVRHRLASYAQESTRYVNYAKKDEITVIKPYWTEEEEEEKGISLRRASWMRAMETCEKEYLFLIGNGLPPQAARGVLPIDIKTEIVITANIREWRNIFKLRCASGAHPDMKRLMRPLHKELCQIFPVLFSDIVYEK